jgi:hypothetical protein
MQIDSLNCEVQKVQIVKLDTQNFLLPAFSTYCFGFMSLCEWRAGRDFERKTDAGSNGKM